MMFHSSEVGAGKGANCFGGHSTLENAVGPPMRIFLVTVSVSCTPLFMNRAYSQSETGCSGRIFLSKSRNSGLVELFALYYYELK
jgi:hypothetical protein